MFNFALRRLLQSVPTILLASLLIFTIIYAAPGDFLTPAELNPNISEEQIEQLRINMGLDKSVIEQYLVWMKNIIFHGEFGLSFMYQQPVLDVITPRIINSFMLAGIIFVLFYAISLPLGVYGAVKQNTFADKAINTFMYIMLGFPSFFIALIAIFLIMKINNWLGTDIPVIGMTSNEHDSLSALGKALDILKHLVVPALIAAVTDVAALTRTIRALMIEQLGSDYVRTARSKGISSTAVIWKHTFRNAVLPIVAGMGGLLPALISGAGFIEVVFSYPGITPMILAALAAQDLYLIAGFSLITSFLLIIGNIVADFFLSVVDPRVRLE